MGLIEAVIRALIYLCLIVLAYFICVLVLSALGLALPLMVGRVIMIIFGLIAVLVLLRLLWPVLSSYTWFPPSNPPPG